MSRIIGFINLQPSLQSIYIQKHKLKIYNELEFFVGCPTIILDFPENYIKYLNYKCDILINVVHNWQIPLEIRHKTEYIYDTHETFICNKNKSLLNHLYYLNNFYKTISSHL